MLYSLDKSNNILSFSKKKKKKKRVKYFFIEEKSQITYYNISIAIKTMTNLTSLETWRSARHSHWCWGDDPSRVIYNITIWKVLYESLLTTFIRGRRYVKARFKWNPWLIYFFYIYIFFLLLFWPLKIKKFEHWP